MPSIIVIDPQPLACMGMQVYLQQLLPGSDCQTVYLKETIATLQPSAEYDLLVLGLNQEDKPTTAFLKGKALEFGALLPVIVLYEVFEIEHLRQFAGHAPIGFISKDNVANQLEECARKVFSGESFLCEKTSQHVINAYINSGTTGRKSRRKRTDIAPGH